MALPFARRIGAELDCPHVDLMKGSALQGGAIRSYEDPQRQGIASASPPLQAQPRNPERGAAPDGDSADRALRQSYCSTVRCQSSSKKAALASETANRTLMKYVPGFSRSDRSIACASGPSAVLVTESNMKVTPA
jgi:hypothetical protein